MHMQEFPIRAGSELIGVALKNAPVHREFGVIVVAVMDENGETHFNPGPDLVMKEGNILVGVGPSGGLERLARATRAESAS